MTTFLLVPGGGADPSYWRFVVAGLAARGHRGVAIDLPCEDDAAGLDAYADAVDALFYNGVDAAVVAADAERAQSDTPSLQPWPEDALPRVPTSFVILRDDRFFPEAFMRRVVADRLGITPVTTPGGHMAMLSHPVELTERLITEAARLSAAPSS